MDTQERNNTNTLSSYVISAITPKLFCQRLGNVCALRTKVKSVSCDNVATFLLVLHLFHGCLQTYCLTIAVSRGIEMISSHTPY